MNILDGNKISFLEKCPSDRLLVFIHEVIDNLCEKIGPKYQDYSEFWSLEEWWDVVDQVKIASKSVVKNQWTKDEAEKELKSLDASLQQQLLTAIHLRQDEIRHTLVNSTTAISQAHLKDFDWQVNLVMSSDKLSSIQEPILNLDLDIQRDSDTKITSVELDKQDLVKMISTLEAANKAVSHLKS
ncbi:COMM domain-containing protein 8-like [Lineus longissimus]|uniref:COMM domain-containing protein 8-like n=1 Tax=Lineus longissimus TaxID=88925 RepID=UPI002B4D2F26